MSKSSNIKQKLLDIYDTRNFSDLDKFTDKKKQDALAEEEKKILASLFVLRGKYQLKEDYNGAVSSFTLATELDAKEPSLYFQIAKALLADDHSAQSLTYAAQMMQKATELNSNDPEYWHTWADILSHHGFQDGSFETLAFALEKFQIAANQHDHTQSLPHCDFFYHWARCHARQGKTSGEAVDFNHALEKFQKAEELGCDHSEFWSEYACALLNLGALVDRKDLYYQSRSYLEKALKKDASMEQAWVNLGICSKKIFESTGALEELNAATEAFENAVSLNSQLFLAWAQWGQILSISAKLQHDMDKLHLSAEKFEKAHEIVPDHPYVLAGWGEVDVAYGAGTDQLWFLQEGERKLLRAYELCPDEAHFLYLLGLCYNEMGAYFDESDYYRKAIDKFQKALLMRNDSVHTWWGIATSYFLMGEHTGDIEALLQSDKYYLRGLEFSHELIPQFWNDWGVVFMKLGELTGDEKYYEEALDRFVKIVDIEEIDVLPEWYYNYGCALDYLGDYYENPEYFEKAIESFKQTLEIEPDFPYVKYNLALAYSHLGEFTANADALKLAIECFDQVIQIDPEDDCAWDEWGLTYVHLAELIKDPTNRESVGYLYEEAENKFSHALALGNTNTYYNMACLYALTDRPEFSMHLLHKADSTKSLPPWIDIMNDEWLDALKKRADFREFVSRRTQDINFDEFNS